jgi:hypothetical protein
MLRLRALLLSGLVAASLPLAVACAPALDFDGLTGGSKTDAAGDGTVDAQEDGKPPTDAASDSFSPDAGSDSPGDAPSSADAVDAIEEYSANPCANVPSADNGAYCGKSTQNRFCCGMPNTLYKCVNGGVAATQVCSPDCILESMGLPDTCDECNSKHDGVWCGSEFAGYSSLLANVVFTCQAGVYVSSTPCTGAQPVCQPNDGGATCIP